jgi:urease accessory protein
MSNTRRRCPPACSAASDDQELLAVHDPGHDHTHLDHVSSDRAGRALRVGIGGPVGTGKTALVAALCSLLRDELRIGVVTNDIYTTEDADALKRRGVLDDRRIVAVQTGCCPHTAIREDITANLDAIEDLEEREGPLDLVLLESGGDNLTLTFSRGLVDAQLFVLDVAGGDKVPRKGGPGVTRSDLLVINKIDIAHLVHADLGVMARDAAAQRGDLPTVLISLNSPEGAEPVAAWIRGQLAATTGTPS